MERNICGLPILVRHISVEVSCASYFVIEVCRGLVLKRILMRNQGSGNRGGIL